MMLKSRRRSVVVEERVKCTACRGTGSAGGFPLDVELLGFNIRGNVYCEKCGGTTWRYERRRVPVAFDPRADSSSRWRAIRPGRRSGKVARGRNATRRMLVAKWHVYPWLALADDRSGVDSLPPINPFVTFLQGRRAEPDYDPTAPWGAR